MKPKNALGAAKRPPAGCALCGNTRAAMTVYKTTLFAEEIQNKLRTLRVMKVPLAILLLLHGVSATVPTALETRFGLSFSPTAIVASRFNAAGSIELHSFPASAAYREYYHEVAGKDQASSDDLDEARVKTIFENDVVPINDSLYNQLGHAPEFATLFLPSVFDRSTTAAAGEAVFRDSKYATRAAPSRRAACYGFDFLRCKNLGRSLSDCDDDELESLVLLFEYEKEYLYMWLEWILFAMGIPIMEQKRI